MRERSFPKGSSRFGNPLAKITLQADFALGIERQCLPRADRRQPYLVCRLLLEKKKNTPEFPSRAEYHKTNLCDRHSCNKVGLVSYVFKHHVSYIVGDTT